MKKIFTFSIAALMAMSLFADQPATLILRAGDVWGDGSGYQMLLDANATAYGTLIPENGPLTSSGDASDALYAEFEYKIPANADGKLSTTNIVFNSSASIEIPAGTYDFCFTNPSPGDRIYIVSEYGDIRGRQDDYVFEAGKIYEFVISLYSIHDGVAVTITDPTQGVENTTVETKAVKVIHDGQLVIERDGKAFNAQGAQVR